MDKTMQKGVNSIINYYDNQIKYLRYMQIKLLYASILLFPFMIIVSIFNRKINYILMAFYLGYVVSVIQDYNITNTVKSVFIRIKRRKYLYKKLKQRKFKREESK